MNILHIVSVTGDPCNGVHVAVPQHIQAQQKIANVAVVNAENVPVEGAKNQFAYKKPFSVRDLPTPFDAPDLVVFHEVYKPEYLSASAHLRKCNIPYVIVPHGSLTKAAQQKKRIKKFFGNALLFNRFINNAKAIQFLSGKEHDTSRNQDVGFVGTNGVMLPDAFKTEFHKDEVSMVFIGRKDIYYKGLDLLLSGIAAEGSDLKKNNAQIHLYGPGDDKDLSALDEQIRNLQLGQLVCCHDGVQGAQKREALLSADIFIQTSRSEGMPMGILEALSYGLPCLVTEETNLGALIRAYDAGWVVGLNEKEIANGLKLAISQRDQWSFKSANAIRLIKENFLWDTVAKNTLSEYSNILSKG